MKSIIYLVIFAFSFSAFASSLTLDEMAGVYEVKPKSAINFLDEGMTIEYKLAVSTDKDEFDHNIIGLNEYIMRVLPDGTHIMVAELKCHGTAQMSEELLITSSVVCDNQSQFEQKINLAKVKDPKAEKFEAPVFSSLYGTEVMMNFRKTQSFPSKK